MNQVNFGEVLLAPTVAKALGIKTGTLSHWRRAGRGPRGWIRRSRTVVVYPRREVEAYLEELGSSPHVDGPRPPNLQG